jgi:hypothetical protein
MAATIASSSFRPKKSELGHGSDSLIPLVEVVLDFSPPFI